MGNCGQGLLGSIGLFEFAHELDGATQPTMGHRDGHDFVWAGPNHPVALVGWDMPPRQRAVFYD